MKNLATGVVKKWLGLRGFGFIACDDGTEVFVHISEIQGKDSLTEGEKVEFEIQKGPKGPKAINVKSISK